MNKFKAISHMNNLKVIIYIIYMLRNKVWQNFGLKFIECTCTKMYEKPLMIIEA